MTVVHLLIGAGLYPIAYLAAWGAVGVCWTLFRPSDRKRRVGRLRNGVLKNGTPI